MSDIWTPPRAALDPNPGADLYAVDMRQRHINHEASVRSVGILYYLGSVFWIMFGIVEMFADDRLSGLGVKIFVSALLFGLGAFQIWIARGLRTLKPRGRIGGGVLSAIGLLGFPFGTLINGYILYLLFSAKGTTVFSEEYQQVIAQTPDIKSRTSIIVWAFLALVVVFVGFAFITSALNRL